MAHQQIRKFVNFGWGEDGLPSVKCRARVVLPPAVDCNCCYSWLSQRREKGKWCLARTSVEVRSVKGLEMVLCCRSDTGGGEVMSFSLFHVCGLRRMRVDGEAAPGLEVCLAGQLSRLQLLGVPSGHSEQGDGQTCTSWARLQVLHAFLAETFAFNNKALAAEAEVCERSERSTPHPFLQVCPLEWPLEGGKRASMEHLLLALRGITAMKAKEVPQRVRFAGSACPLCLEPWEEMPPERGAVALACGHGFCECCMATTVEHEQKSCPCCRQTIPAPGQVRVASKPPQAPLEEATLA